MWIWKGETGQALERDLLRALRQTVLDSGKFLNQNQFETKRAISYGNIMDACSVCTLP